MRIHIIVDFMHLFYKYKFRVDSGTIKDLTAGASEAPIGGFIINEPLSVSKIYYPLKDITGIRRGLEKEGHEVTLSVCFDDKSNDRKEINGDYKSNRVGKETNSDGSTSKLSEYDLFSIEMTKNLVKLAGYNMYFCQGREADDVVYNLLRTSKGKFDFNIVYTNDLDLTVNVGDNVGVQVYRNKLGYTAVGKKTYQQYMMQRLGCNVPYNAIMLYKATCGDPSDKIQGIKRFGPAAFEKYMEHLKAEHTVNWESLSDGNEVARVLRESLSYLGEDKIEQALDSLKLVVPIEFDVEAPVLNGSTQELREEAFKPLEMISLAL